MANEFQVYPMQGDKFIDEGMKLSKPWKVTKIVG